MPKNEGAELLLIAARPEKRNWKLALEKAEETINMLLIALRRADG